jgi:predicted dehydrogenase
MPAMSAHEPTVGVIGLRYGRAHIPAFQANGCRVVAVCQRDQAGAKAVADRYGVPRVFGSWEQMLDEARPDIVVVATPPVLHHAIVLRAFAAGAHVLCEKPLAMNRAEAQAMVDAAARSGRVGMTAFNWRFTAAMLQFHATLGEGVVGRVFNLAARWFGSRLADEKAAPSWRQDRAQAGHGAMGDMGVHVIDLIRWNFGEFTRVVVDAGVAYPERRAPGVNHPADVDDHCSVLGELASGAHVAFTVSRVAHATNDQSLEAWGHAGALRYRLTREGARWFEGELHVSRNGADYQPVPPRWTPPPAAGEGDQSDVMGKALIAPLVERMLHGIRTGQPVSPSLADGLRSQAVLDAVLESSRLGAWVTLDDA